MALAKRRPLGEASTSGGVPQKTKRLGVVTDDAGQRLATAKRVERTNNSELCWATDDIEGILVTDNAGVRLATANRVERDVELRSCEGGGTMSRMIKG